MTPEPLSSALARVLQAGRGQFNARVSEACRMQPGFDVGIVKALLRGPLDRLAAQAEALAPERMDGLLFAAFDVGLNLALRGKHDHPFIQALWRDVLPACLPLALRQPCETLGALFNAALYLLPINGVRTNRWAQDMGRLASQCADLTSLKQLGQVLAWRHGVAHFRTSALEVARRLVPELAMQALACAPGTDVAAALTHLENHPWFDPERPAERGLRATHAIGGFTGFGGPFPCPPEVRVHGEGFVVNSADRYWYLCADAFGAVLHAGSLDEFAAGTTGSGALSLDGNVLRLGEEHCALDLPPAGLRAVCGPATAAVHSPYSHFIRLLALS